MAAASEALEFSYFWPRRRFKALENVFPWKTKLIPSQQVLSQKSWRKTLETRPDLLRKTWDNEVRMITSERFTLRGTLTISQARASRVLAFFNLSLFCSCTKPRSCKPFSSFTCQLVLVMGLQIETSCPCGFGRSAVYKSAAPWLPSISLPVDLKATPCYPTCSLSIKPRWRQIQESKNQNNQKVIQVIQVSVIAKFAFIQHRE